MCLHGVLIRSDLPLFFFAGVRMAGGPLLPQDLGGSWLGHRRHLVVNGNVPKQSGITAGDKKAFT